MSGLSNLSPADFEDLCRDIAQAELGVRFEAFGPGADGGIDGRYSVGSDNIILQCKHYFNSTFSQLKRSAIKEMVKVLKIKPSRYIFFCSNSLTPMKRKELLEIFESTMSSYGDIWGKEDIEAALRRHPSIEKSHIKLWLSSSAVLEKILHSGLEEFTHSTKDEILHEVKLYAKNKSFDDAIEILEKEKTLIISGPPGVGKTTLAKMISYHYLNEDWKFHAIRSLDDGFAKINNENPTLFFFDDFLGRIDLDKDALRKKDNAFITFVNRIAKSKNSRFILTTRSHIFEEARRLSDNLDNGRVQLAKYLLDVGIYTRKIKAMILFNHLAYSELNSGFVEHLLHDDWLKKIIDHKNYNPRIISSVSSELIENVNKEDYPQYIYNALNNPNFIWEKSFLSLSIMCQNLLACLFFSNQYWGASIEELRLIYSKAHRAVCLHYNQSSMPNDFDSSLKILESGFVSISDTKVTFVNPSLRDFLRNHLVDIEYLSIFPEVSERLDWAENLWDHVKEVCKSRNELLNAHALKYQMISQKMLTVPTLKITKNNNYISMSYNDLSIIERVRLLLDWWDKSHDYSYVDIAIKAMNSDKLEIYWSDGQSIPELYCLIRDNESYTVEYKNDLLIAVEKYLIRVLNSGLAIDELASMIESIYNFGLEKELPNVKCDLDSVVDYELEETWSAINSLDSEDELLEHLDYLTNIAKSTKRDIEYSRDVIFKKIADLEDEYYERTSFSNGKGYSKNEKDIFDDEEMKSLFSSLIKSP